MAKRALITGITGQDGSYLAEHLLDLGYDVHGVIRRSSSINTKRLSSIANDLGSASPRLTLHYGDLTDEASILRIVADSEPDEIYNLGCQSHVRVSFDNPFYTLQSGAVGTLAVLNAAVQLNKKKHVRVYQASSSEMYGGMPGTAPQSETTPFHPRSPYGCAKVYSYHQTVNYREAYSLFACNGILFNHESPRRDETFVTRKITRAATRIKAGFAETLHLGNLDAQRDWGYAKDYVKAIWLMLQQDVPDDYVIATNTSHTVENFVVAAFEAVQLDWREHVKIDSQYFRPSEVAILRGDPAKAKARLGWTATTSFSELVNLMVASDLELAKRERAMFCTQID